MADEKTTINAEDIKVELNLQGSVILNVREYNALRHRADMYDEMLYKSIESIKVVSKDPTTYSPSACELEGHIHIAAPIIRALKSAIISQVMAHDEWLEPIVEHAITNVNLKDMRFSDYASNSPYCFSLLDDKHFAEIYYAKRSEMFGNNE